MVLVVDLVSKRVAEDELRETVRLLPGLELDLGFNSGVAFGALSDLPTVALVSSVGLVVAALTFGVVRGWLVAPWPAAGLLLGGALGNAIDRITDGRVTDFIDPARWPPFNVADIAITVGVALLLLRALMGDRRSQAAPTAG